MLKSKVLSAAVAAALVAGAASVQAATVANTAGTHAMHQPQLDPGTRAQLAAEAGLTPQQASGLTLSQLALMKMHRDGDDGAYSGLGVTPPAPATHG